ncbi:hypothetical protein V6N11_077827 [Hibiscus sabdariffa]|uniref:Uncharacterized protein n=1 Tax=Hibiscus sabdariffa TaxID=183260 RepID=A0ABR2TF54_9ROSI
MKPRHRAKTKLQKHPCYQNIQRPRGGGREAIHKLALFRWIAQEKLGIEPKLGIDKKGIEHKKDDEDLGANDNVLINEGLERWTKGKPNACETMQPIPTEKSTHSATALQGE